MKSNNYFLTGMGRSGTTLLEKLLSNHPDISMLSQPFPLLFIEFKKAFLKHKNIVSYYALNDSLDNSNYDQKEFNSFLKDYIMDNTMIYNVFKNMENYSGQKTKFDNEVIDVKSSTFLNLHKFLIQEIAHKQHSISYGSKEILCEEFLPLMTENNFKTTIIIRDPRDVLASANYPRGEKYLGIKKPSLFLLRSWRKSIEYVKFLNGRENFHFLKYEDLVMNPYEELDRITSYLGLPNFEKDCFDKGIFNQNGDLWSANSSFHTKESFISKNSLGVYKDVLTKEEIDYTEAICGEEMLWVGYNVELDEKDKGDVIRYFKDFDIEDNPHLSKNFSSDKNNVEFELSRLKLSTSGD